MIGSRTAVIVLACIAGVLAVGAGIAVGFLLDDDPAVVASPASDAPPADSGGGAGLDRAPVDDLEAVNRSLPSGFVAEIVAEGIPYPTATAVTSDGTFYLGGLEDDQGTLYAYRDGDGDGVLDEPMVAAEGFATITGILVDESDLYVASRGTVSVLHDSDGDGSFDDRRDIITGLPAEYPVHANNGLAIGPDGKLYFGVGATCNACKKQNPPAASVQRCELDGTGCEVYASGLRNVYDLAFRPGDGVLFAADNGAEAIGGANLEIEDELNVIAEDEDYGWPLCWGIEKGLDCDGTVPAVAEIQPHAAPAGIAFYTGSVFPPAYRDDLYLTLWGDTGRSVVRAELGEGDDGTPTARLTDFVRMNRPVDVVAAPDGSLLVTDSDAARVYRIVYQGAG